MKWIVANALLMLLSLQKNCTHKQASSACFKGRLEVKGICSNYTIKLVEGNIDTALVQANWVDETTNKQYTNVFALDNPCSFPTDIQQGDTFYFTLNTQQDKGCNVCLAYYPVPSKRLAITAFKMPCP